MSRNILIVPVFHQNSLVIPFTLTPGDGDVRNETTRRNCLVYAMHTRCVYKTEGQIMTPAALQRTFTENTYPGRDVDGGCEIPPVPV